MGATLFALADHGWIGLFLPCLWLFEFLSEIAGNLLRLFGQRGLSS